MSSDKMYVHQDTLESTQEYIEKSLVNGSSVHSIARGMIGTDKAVLIVTKEYEMHIDEVSDNEEMLKLLVDYINDSYKEHMQRSCVSDVIKATMEKNFYGIDIDEYSDYLTDLLNDGAYQRVNHHITNIMASYEPYMKEHNSNNYEVMTTYEHEVAIINFIKENLCACSINKPVIKKSEKIE